MIDDALLLKRSRYRENDDIVDGIGQESGRFSAVFKGSRKRGSATSALLDPPVRLRLRLNQGESLDSASQPLLVNAFLPLRKDLDGLAVAGFLGRLFLSALPQRLPEPEVFEMLVALMEALSDGLSPRWCGLWGQERLLGCLGLSPAVDECQGCGSDQIAGYSSAAGGVLCGRCYQGEGFALDTESLNLCRSLRWRELRAVDPGFNRTAIRSVGRLYKEHFQAHLGVSPDHFRRVLTSGESL